MTHTFKSRRRTKRRRGRVVMPPAWHSAVAARRREDEVRRIALPERAPGPSAGAEVVHIPLSGPGWAHDVRLLVPADRGRNRPRSDQFRVVIDGAVWAERAGLTAVFRHLHANVIPPVLTRRQRYLSDQEREAVIGD